ncbi:MAG: helix-turn-helix domain-containing protein, partial [Chitinophagaceae bacterium]
HIIRKYRELRNYTQEYVAKQMGISQNAYSKIENNYTQLTVAHINQLSKIFEVGITDLLREDFEIHRPSKIQMHSVTKENLVMTAETILNKIKQRNPQKHDFYPVIMALFQTIDTTLENVG